MSKRIGRSVESLALDFWLTLMFLFAFNFISAGGYLLLGMMAVYFIWHLRDFSFRAAEVFLFLFAAEYFLFYALWFDSASFREVCNFLIAPWMLYWLGRNITYQSRQHDFPLKIITVLTLGFFAYGFLCICYSLYYSPPTMGSRLLYKFWDHNKLSVTAGGLLFAMPIGVSMGQLTTKNSLRKRLFWLAVLTVCIFYAFTWAHRSSIYIIVILAIYNYLSYLFSLKINAGKKAVLFCCSVLLIAAMLLCLSMDVGGCFTWLQEQWLYKRLTDSTAANSTDRLEIWQTFLKQWLLYPLGGKQFPISAAYVHNLWLDVYYLCGALPFTALVIVTVMIVRNLFQYRKVQIQQGNHRSSHIIFNCYIAIFLAFMVEPALNAYPYIVLAAILISGSIDGAIMQARKSPPSHS